MNTRFIVIQIDTDKCDEKGFDVKRTDETETLIENVIARLVQAMNEGDADFYSQNSEKILFCISVHSLECWFYAHYNQKPTKKPKITGCHAALTRVVQSLEKNKPCYDQLSQCFLKRKNIDTVSQKDSSFCIFIRSLARVEKEVQASI